MKKKFPVFNSDEEAEAFLEQDISDYLHAGNFVSARNFFEFETKDKTLTMRVPARLLAAVKIQAAKKRMPYQRFIRSVLENAVGGAKAD